MSVRPLIPSPWKRSVLPVSHATRLTCITANVLTMQETRSMPSASERGCNVSGRRAALQLEFALAGASIVGLQETRSKNAFARKSDAFFMVASAATKAGTDGCELWVATALKPSSSTARPIISKPSLLVVALRLPCAQITVMVAHAPVEQQPRNVRDNWNERLESLMTARVDFSSLVVLIDANARLGSLHSQHIGPFYREPQNGNGELLHRFLKDTDVSAASTFCEKSGPTWRSSKGTQHRIDYVLLPCSWMGRLHDASTHYGVNLQLAERVDHFAVVDIGCDNDVSLITRKPRIYDLAAARDDDEKRDEFRRRIGEIPMSRRTLTPSAVSRYCSSVFGSSLLMSLPVEKKRIPWMSNASWELMASKRPLLKRLKCMKHLLRIQEMRTCWLSWRSACGRCRPPCVPSLALVRQVVLLSREISDRTSEIRRSLEELRGLHPEHRR